MNETLTFHLNCQRFECVIFWTMTRGNQSSGKGEEGGGGANNKGAD